MKSCVKYLSSGLIAISLLGTYVMAGEQASLPLQILLSPGQTHFEVKLAANPTTGYQWFLTKYPSHEVHFIGYHYARNPAPAGMVGVPGNAYFTFSTASDFQIGPQEITLEFVYQQPWAGGAVSQPYPVHVLVLPIDEPVPAS